eukprot:maker-scaffold_60-snap-gene-0.51-mRNA-1 protein AED:0.22 eAED:0.22 QI:971/0.25/0.2/1/1/1/5/0/319
MSNEIDFEPIKNFSGWHVRTIVKECKPLEVHIRFPKVFKLKSEDHNVFLYLPGSDRNVTAATNEELIQRADAYRVILMTIYAVDSKQKLNDDECPSKVDRFKYFRYPVGYQWNNVGQQIYGNWKYVYNFENHFSSYVENAFLVMKKEVGFKANGFHYYGHSAGAQVVMRHVLFGEESSLKLIKSACAANILTLLMVQKLQLTVALGDQDVVPVGRDNAVAGQGLTRVDRGLNYFEYLKNKSFFFEMEDFVEETEFADWEDQFRWQQVIVEGAGHNTHQLWPTCWNISFGEELPVFHEDSGTLDRLGLYFVYEKKTVQIG